jgi:hypothetical protein
VYHIARWRPARIEAKRRALDEIASLQRAADVKRKEDTERREQAAVMCESVIELLVV